MVLTGPSGCLQLAPLVQIQISDRLTSPLEILGEKTSDPSVSKESGG